MKKAWRVSNNGTLVGKTYTDENAAAAAAQALVDSGESICAWVEIV